MVDDEELARLGVCTPRSMERNQVAPRICRPHRQHADMERGGLQCSGDIRGHLSTGEERLCITGRDDVELAVVVELADRKQRVSCSRFAERECVFELIPLGISRSAARQETVRMLSRDSELRGQVSDRQPLPAQKRLPDLGFIPHGDDRNP